MRIIFSALLAFMLASPFAFASVGLNMNGKDSGAVGDINIINTSSATTTWSDGFTVSIPILDPNLFGTGMGNGSAVSQVSTAVAVSTSASLLPERTVPENAYREEAIRYQIGRAHV